jgi:hypothetical protein
MKNNELVRNERICSRGKSDDGLAFGPLHFPVPTGIRFDTGGRGMFWMRLIASVRGIFCGQPLLPIGELMLTSMSYVQPECHDMLANDHSIPYMPCTYFDAAANNTPVIFLKFSTKR